jgi:hypothetical protein
MELLINVSHVESCFGLFGDNVSISAREVHGLRQTYHRLRSRFGCTRWNSSVTWVMRNLVLVRLKIVSVSVQDRSMVYAKGIIGS